MNFPFLTENSGPLLFYQLDWKHFTPPLTLHLTETLKDSCSPGYTKSDEEVEWPRPRWKCLF